MRVIIVAFLFAICSQSQAAAETAKPIDVMVVGSWHFANHNRDLHNVQSANVLTDSRQAELESVAHALERYRPTKVMVEQLPTTSDLIDHKFEKFSSAMLRSDPEEYVQIAYRVASDLRLPHVYAINEQPSEGEPDYFPYGKVQEFAEKHGQGKILESINTEASAQAQAFAASQSRKTIADLLIDINSPNFYGGIGSYYRMLAIGDTDEQVGADLNAMWYLRNAKIFAKLMKVVQPGDRVLIVYGAGHAYWLRHFANEVPGFANVDPVPFLATAAKKH